MTENHALVEAMARAIAEQGNRPDVFDGGGDDGEKRWLREAYTRDARAALQAYRTFTQDDGK